MKWLLAMQLTAWSALVAIGGELPRVWMSTSFMKDLGVFEKTVKDCRAHGVDVMDNGPTPGARICAERLSICRAHGMKLHVGVSDASKNEMLAKKTGNYELAAMSGGCNAATCRKMLRALWGQTPRKACKTGLSLFSVRRRALNPRGMEPAGTDPESRLFSVGL